MKKTFLYLSIIGSFLLTSCNSDDSDTNASSSGNYSNGIWIINQGNFGSSNASLSFYDGVIENEVYQTVNNMSLGDTAQSTTIDGDELYIVVNVSNKVVVIDRHTGELITEIEGLNNPRYAAKVSKNQLYVTNWGDGSNATDDFVSIINTDSHTVEKSITVSEGPEKIVVANDKAYILHKGGWGYGSTVTSIDIATEETNSITVGDVPGSFDIEGDDLYVLCKGKPSYATAETEGTLYKIDTSSDEASLVIDFDRDATVSHPKNFQLSDNEYNVGYYEMSGTLYKQSLQMDEDPTIVLQNLNISDMKIQGASLYYTNAGDYSSAGTFVQYNLTTQTEISKVTTGIIPGDITFTP